MIKNNNLKLLVIGGGILEHALVAKLSQSPKVEKIYAAPGNEGMKDIATCVDIPETDQFQLLKFAKKEKIDLTIVGPYRLIADGIADQFHKERLRIFAPRSKQAEIGSSRIVAKELMRHYSIPTVPYHIFENVDGVINFCEHARNFNEHSPLVLKIDGTALAGTVVCRSMDDVTDYLDKVMKKKIFGEAGDRIIVENFIHGDIVSMTTLIDNNTMIPFPPCQIVREFTNSERIPVKLGAFYPATCISNKMLHHIEREVAVPLVHAINRQYHSYKGFLTIDMIITDKGARVVDFKIQWSDILAQVLLTLYKGDILDLMLHTLNGSLNEIDIDWYDKNIIGLVAIKNSQQENQSELTLLPDFSVDDPDIKIFSGKTRKIKEKTWTSGSRLLGITSVGDNLETAYKKIENVISEYGLSENIAFRIPKKYGKSYENQR